MDHVELADLNKYLERGLAQMPWTELSQKDFLEFVVPYDVLTEDELLKQSIVVMDTVVKNPDRLHHSAFHKSVPVNPTCKSGKSSVEGSPSVPRKSVSRTNSLRQSMKEVELRKVTNDKKGSRPSSIILS